MSKFTGKDQVFTFNTETSGTNFCVSSVDLNIATNILTANCAGSSTVSQVAGQSTVNMTVNGFIESQKMDDLFDDASGAFAPQTNNSDLVWNPEGGIAASGNPTVTSTSATIGNVDISDPVDGLCSFSMALHLDDYAIGAL